MMEAISLFPSALDPTTGIKSLQVKIGNNQPSDPMEMGMVPYAMYAEEALSVAKDAITSKEIKDGSIKAADLDPTINFSAFAGQIAESQLPSTVTLDTELNAHINSTSAHPATAITVVGPFTFTQATNLQQILKDLDSNLLNEVANRIISRDNLNVALGAAANRISPLETKTQYISTTTPGTTQVSGAIDFVGAAGSAGGGGSGGTGGTTISLQGSTGNIVTTGSITATGGITSAGTMTATGMTITGGGAGAGGSSQVLTTSSPFSGDISGTSSAITIVNGAVTSGKIADDTIINADINSAANISWSKVSKSGAVPGDVGAAAASHTHLASDITSGTFADGRIAQSNVTQHQGALSLGAGQIASGTLPVTRGGTGVTVSTGTGSVVLDTSPTLTSPTINSPTINGTITTSDLTQSDAVTIDTRRVVSTPGNNVLLYSTTLNDPENVTVEVLASGRHDDGPGVYRLFVTGAFRRNGAAQLLGASQLTPTAGEPSGTISASISGNDLQIYVSSGTHTFIWVATVRSIRNY